jgi:hypothetical protein
MRRRLRVGILVVVWCAVVLAFVRTVLELRLDHRVGPFRLTFRDPARSLTAAFLAVGLYVLLYGRALWKERENWLARHGRTAATLLALATLAVALRWATYAATWADPSGYVSQADLWLRGTLRVSQGWAAQFDWPRVDWVFSPLGYRPGNEPHAIVPIYAPGIPLLMALAKSLIGVRGPFVVVPILGSLGVWLTYRLGRALLSEEEGLVASALLASSPVFLTHVLFPMSDVAAMTCWTLSAVLLLGVRRASPLFAGLAGAMAILIRPNLAPLAGVLALIIVARERSTGFAVRPAASEVGRFVAGLLPGIVGIVALHEYLYGGVLESGYGNAGGLYALSRGPKNLLLYVGWLRETHGVLALLIPLGLLAPGALALAPRRDIAGGVSPKALVFGVTAAVWLCYLFYYSFDERFFLRFLLPAWPMMSVAVAAALAWISRPAPARWRPVIVLVLGLGIVAVQWRTAVDLGVFRWQDSEQRYVQVARAVASATPPNAMIFAMQHSGSVRYYAHRPTLRYDELAPGLLDKAIADLEAKGYRPYAVLEDFEVDVFRRRFSSSQSGRLTQGPVNVGMPARAFMYDLLEGAERRQSDLLRTSHPRARMPLRASATVPLSASPVTMSIASGPDTPSLRSTARAICSCSKIFFPMIAWFAPSDFSIATPTASTATRSSPAMITFPAFSSPLDGPPSVNAATPSSTMRFGL